MYINVNVIKGVRHFQECVDASVVGIFNPAQREAGRGTCSNVVLLNGYGKNDQSLLSIRIKQITVTLVPE